ncbi:hypothetical protein INR49_004277 [Caranx melampygus]|nr:hypothetical protein INR49_004277 [Caranx melampygus]
MDSNTSQPQYPGPRPTLMAGHMEIPAALKNPQRKQSRVSICKELSDMSDSPESDHYPTARKCSFMSRGMSEGKLATPSDSADSQSGTDTEAQHLNQGESPVMTPPPPAGGRRMSMFATKSGSLSEGPGDPWKLGSGVAEPEWVVRSMLVVVALVTAGLWGGLGSWAALLLAVELAGRSTGQ